MYQIETTPDFDRNIKALDPPIAARIIKKIEWLAEHPELLRSPLKNMPKDLKGLQKYKVGDHRILLWVDHNHESIILYAMESNTAEPFTGDFSIAPIKQSLSSWL
jgi:mRNA-degrading endonuclease RelE of RelBE toxin-antitoxin system